MKIYNTEVSYQNFGTSWLIILKGAEKDIEESYNSFYNFCASGIEPNLDWRDGAKTVATFWSNETRMKDYFKNIFEICREGLETETVAFVDKNLAELRNSPESFWDFRKHYMPDVHETGTIKAERPDNDFKDLVILNGLTNEPKTDKVTSNE